MESSGVYFIVFLVLTAIWVLGGIVCLWLAMMAGFEGKKRPWRVAAIFFLGPVVVLMSLIAVGLANSPVMPSRADILGDYKVDRGFYPGEQADWQHEIYSMKITEEWVELRDVRTEKVWREEIQWVEWSEYCWSFKSSPKHHMVRGGPAIVREKLGYSYVFESSLYGVVVFRKEGVTTKLKLLLAGGFVLFLWLCFWLSKSFEKKCIRP